MLEYSSEDKIELVLNFYTFGGYPDEDIEEFPEAMKFKADNCCEKTEKNRWVLNHEGEVYLHEFIYGMTEELYSIIQKEHSGISLKEAKQGLRTVCECDDECLEEFIRYLVKNANGHEYESEITYAKDGERIGMRKV